MSAAEKKERKTMMRKMKTKSTYTILFGITIILLFSACSNTKYLAQGEQLYVGADVKLKPDTSFNEKYIKSLEEHLEENVSPKPNSSFFGLKFKLFIYNLARSAKTEKGIKGWLKYKIGEAPVLLSEVNREYNEGLLVNRLENLGFFQSAVESDTTIKKRRATVTYFATPNHNYKIKNIEFNLDSATTLGKIIIDSKSKSLLQEGRPYNLDVIKTERERIDNELKEKGFFYSDPDNFLVQVDSTIGKHQVNMYMKLKEQTPMEAREQFHINNIYIYPDYNLSQGDYPIGKPDSSTLYKGYHIVDPENTFRKFALVRSMFFEKGNIYNRNYHNRTISHLVGLGTFKFVKNNFTRVDTTENLLDIYYYLTPLPKKALRLEVIGKTASVYNGSEVNLSWLHRNAFKGAELLKLSIFGGYEFQTGGNVDLNSSFYRYGGKASLTFPRIIAPFSWTPSRRFVPHTTLTAGYEFLNRRNAYRLNSLNTAFGYAWKENNEKDHELKVIEVGLVRPGKINPDYELEIENNPNLRRAIERQFTFGPNYYFTYTNTAQNLLKNTQYFKGGIDLSGNIYGLIKGANFNKDKVYQLLNTDFSQYLKLEADFRNYTKIGSKSQVALRAMVGYGYAYGNSSSLPYVKQFYIGGPNSLRGFRARELGPGSFDPYKDSKLYIPDMTGDIKMEFNAEYRPHLFSILRGALFVDAGNIWLLNENENKPGAKFTKNFLKEMAVDAGFGLRFDLTFLVLRTDLAIPLRIPYLPAGERWVMNKINFGDSDWRKSNLIFNLAIGYPF